MPMPKHLKSIGLHIFMTEYEYFLSRPQATTAVAYFVQKGISNEDGAKRRVSHAKYLFDDSNLLREALEYVAYSSKKATSSDREKALKLLSRLS